MTKKSTINITKSEVVSAKGAVGAMHPLAAEAGVEILRQGGNAFDAAVAIGFAIGVVEPFNSGVGAIAVLVAHDAKTGRNHVIDGTGPLPAAISTDLFELADESDRSGVYQWRATRNDANNTGYLASAVPGTPAALCAAHERWGSLPLEQVMAPAIRLADEGWELDWYVSHVFAMQSARLRNFEDSVRTFFRPDGNLLVSKRATLVDGWPAPTDTTIDGAKPVMSEDGLALYYADPAASCPVQTCRSKRTRATTSGNWGAPVVESFPPGNYQNVYLSNDGLRVLLSGPVNGNTTYALATASRTATDAPWGAPVPVAEFGIDPTIRFARWTLDERTMYVAVRQNNGTDDLYVSHLQ